ncbi:MAG: AMIN domain-containing protein [Nostoc sp. S4]|nr:AMIN domain-containing protein [Nostoc sp. S4]
MGYRLKLALVTSVVSLLIAPSTWAGERSSVASLKKGETRLSEALLLKENRRERKIRQLSDFKTPITSAQPLLVKTPFQAGEVIPITGVKANATPKGVEVILETPQGTQLQVTNRSAGNNFIVDVSGGQLRLADGNTLLLNNP